MFNDSVIILARSTSQNELLPIAKIQRFAGISNDTEYTFTYLKGFRQLYLATNGAYFKGLGPNLTQVFSSNEFFEVFNISNSKFKKILEIFYNNNIPKDPFDIILDFAGFEFNSELSFMFLPQVVYQKRTIHKMSFLTQNFYRPNENLIRGIKEAGILPARIYIDDNRPKVVTKFGYAGILNSELFKLLKSSTSNFALFLTDIIELKEVAIGKFTIFARFKNEKVLLIDPKDTQYESYTY